MKPGRHLFKRFCEKATVAPEDCIFVDDGPGNAKAAGAMGMDAIHYTGAPALETQLMTRGVPGGRMFVCSDTDYCAQRPALGHRGRLNAEDVSSAREIFSKKFAKNFRKILAARVVSA